MAGTIIGVIVAVVVTLLIAVPVTCKVAVDKKVRKDAEIIGTAEDKARNILDEALKAAETKKRETLLEVKEESLRTKNELERETKERRNELQRYEKRVLSKEESVDKKANAVEKRELECTAKFNELQEKEKQKLQELMKPAAEKKSDKMKIRHEGGVVIQGVQNLMIRISRCCNPVPGDPIVGYITKGRGISIHRADCPNIVNSPENQARLIEVEWEDAGSSQKEYDTDLAIHGFDRSGLLNDVLQTVNSLTKRISSVEAKADKDKNATIRLTVSIQNLAHLQQIVTRIQQIPDVYSVDRTKG